MAKEKQCNWVMVGRVLFTIGLMVSVLFVFSNSLQIGDVSSDASGRVMKLVKEVITALGAPAIAARITETMVRKTAHVLEYMLVGFFLMFCLRVYTKHFLRHITWPLFGGLFIALIDETIQIFSPGRTATVKDIWIDFFGVSMGVLVALFLLCLWRMVRILYSHREME